MTKAFSQERRSIIFMAAAIALGGVTGQARAQDAPTVLFICERGYAKSLVAALHFERLAAARGIAVKALSRGVDPGAAVPAGIVEGLASDGFEVNGFIPARFTQEEIDGAALVVLIGVDVEVSGPPVNRWDEISALSENYERARSEIVTELEALLDSIGSGQ